MRAFFGGIGGSHYDCGGCFCKDLREKSNSLRVEF